MILHPEDFKAIEELISKVVKKEIASAISKKDDSKKSSKTEDK